MLIHFNYSKVFVFIHFVSLLSVNSVAASWSSKKSPFGARNLEANMPEIEITANEKTNLSFIASMAGCLSCASVYIHFLIYSMFFFSFRDMNKTHRHWVFQVKCLLASVAWQPPAKAAIWFLWWKLGTVLLPHSFSNVLKRRSHRHYHNWGNFSWMNSSIRSMMSWRWM